MEDQARKDMLRKFMEQQETTRQPIQPGDENIYPDSGWNGIMPQGMKSSLKTLKETEAMIPEAATMAGGLAKVGGAVEQAAAPVVREMFPAVKRMFQSGHIEFPAESTAEALKVKEALEAAGKIGPGRSLVQK